MTGDRWARGRLLPWGAPAVQFGRSYEDERIELAAFGEPGRVCVIAAAGETAAACAAAGHRVNAVDINAVQLAYCRDRLAGGPAVDGQAERLMRAGRRLLGVPAPGWRKDVLAAHLDDDGPAAARLWRERLDTPALAALLALVLRPGQALAGWRTPDFAALLPPDFGRELRNRIGRALGRHGIAGNRFAHRLLAGAELPGWRPVTGGAPVRLVRADIADHLAAVPPGHYRGIALSNVIDGVGAARRRRLLRLAHRALAPGGAVVLRSFAPLADPGLAADDRSLIWGAVRVLRR
ncbi:DUF3419 domain-containing protein [Naumannella cuiyingiana]|uniref:DUF3419 family protein n=1 Tax=Naumannella cuiyingiana TaxID=1347891 RepID=A0A7Z0D750_9ACTN|nr:DUF3419 domain-containing protein [Naumannella cuiyingiana]NYI69991.1 hypothetical protein [Naumannella cuiyingiana]